MSNGWASSLSASVPDPRLFEGRRKFAALLGLVPRQYSGGGIPELGWISNIGNRHPRLMVGAHAAFCGINNGKTRSASLSGALIRPGLISALARPASGR
ncbi:transposase [Rhizobium sp. 2YAF20]|uniref:transposase n=1 Tax=Rhizobium sp. 2YAF20 TaxID=3233027 RepID=UPI003F955948